eukprot:6278388-Pyramimonas_sp.AAC.1
MVAVVHMVRRRCGAQAQALWCTWCCGARGRCGVRERADARRQCGVHRRCCAHGCCSIHRFYCVRGRRGGVVHAPVVVRRNT